jgi:ADP-ribosylglycohydrolase
MVMNVAERYRGAMLGLAVGDALGTTLEFSPPGSFAPIDDIVGGGPFRLPAGAWTDDTSMALCLAESLVECGGFDAADQMRRYVRWYREGHMSSTGRSFDIGNTTRAALERFEATGDPWCGSNDPFTAGNGSIMRLAPVVLAFAAAPTEAIAMAARSSRTTHGARDAVDGCRYLPALLLGALGGASKEQLLGGVFGPVPDLWVREPLAPAIIEVAAGSFRRASRSLFKSFVGVTDKQSFGALSASPTSRALELCRRHRQATSNVITSTAGIALCLLSQ